MVCFNVILSFEKWIDIQGCGGVGLVVLKVDGEDFDWNVNQNHKGFVWMSHVWFVGDSRIDEFLLDIFDMEKHGFGFIGDILNEEGKGFSDVWGNGFQHFSGFNWSVVSIRDWSVSGYIIKDGH